MRGQKDPTTGITEGAMRTLLKSNLRPIWRNTSRKVFINSVRKRRLNTHTGKMHYEVQCMDCQRWMGQGEKERRVKKDGGLEKKARSVYDVHHVDGITPLTDIKDTLGSYWYDLIYGEMEIVCVACHKRRSSVQTKERNKGEEYEQRN